jgi:microcystin-dependent protein
MAQPYVGEIRMFGGNFAPAGWAFCDGALLPISNYDTLFNLIGTTYGGDGQSTFGVPDLRGRLPIHFGNGFALAQNGGVEDVTLTINQMPSHNHPALTSAQSGNNPNPNGAYMADEGPAGISQVFSYAPYDGTNQVQLKNVAVSYVGGSQSHSNIQPFLCVSFIISLFGIFPTQT